MIYASQNPHGGDIYSQPVSLDYSVNINPFGPPKAVRDAIVASIDNIAAYPDAHCSDLIKALAVYEQTDEKNILCGNGAAELIFLLVQTWQPQKALIVQPTFCEYEQALKTVEAEITYYYLKEEEGFAITEALLAQLQPDLDMLFLCNPNNPTGLLIEPALREKIIIRCQEMNIFLLVDECFLEFTGEKERHSLVKHLPFTDNLMLLKAFTKSYALPGLRLGYCLSGNHSLLARMAARTQPWNVSLPAQTAGVAALKETEYLQRTVKCVAAERNRLITKLHQLGIITCPGQANFLLIKSPSSLYEELLKRGILIRKCGNFPGLDDHYYRIAVRLPDQNTRLLNAIKEVLNGEINHDSGHYVKCR